MFQAPIDTRGKRKIIDILLLRSAAPEEFVLENLNTDVFSDEEVKELLSYYRVRQNLSLLTSNKFKSIKAVRILPNPCL